VNSNIQARPCDPPALSAASRSYTPSKDTLDEALISRIAAGDRAAMTVLYTRYSVRVHRFIMRLVGNHAVAEELVSEVFLDVWRTAGEFERRSQVATWLLAVARHKALAALRRPSSEPLNTDAAELIEDPADSAEVIVDRNKRSAVLHNCLAQLSPAHREVIDLVYYHERTISDVATILGIAQNTVKTRMFYARKRLETLLCSQGIATARDGEGLMWLH
jgi:RNA polymerase sigma-70 factor (ECF subfamily)